MLEQRSVRVCVDLDSEQFGMVVGTLTAGAKQTREWAHIALADLASDQAEEWNRYWLRRALTLERVAQEITQAWTPGLLPELEGPTAHDEAEHYAAPSSPSFEGPTEDILIVFSLPIEYVDQIEPE